MSTSNLPEVVQQELSAEDVEAQALSSASTLFAVVNANGTLARGFGAVSSSRLGTGVYQVIFNRNVRDCAYVATIGLSGSAGTSPSGEIAVVGLFNNVNGVFVQTFNSAGGPTDLGFHLAVHCKP